MPVNSIWEGSGNVIVPRRAACDAARAGGRGRACSPSSPARGGHRGARSRGRRAAIARSPKPRDDRATRAGRASHRACAAGFAADAPRAGVRRRRVLRVAPRAAPFAGAAFGTLAGRRQRSPRSSRAPRRSPQLSLHCAPQSALRAQHRYAPLATTSDDSALASVASHPIHPFGDFHDCQKHF